MEINGHDRQDMRWHAQRRSGWEMNRAVTQNDDAWGTVSPGAATARRATAER